MDTTKQHNRLNNIDLDTIDMTLDIMKYAINRITSTNPSVGEFQSEEDLYKLVGETITPEGITGEVALKKWNEVLLKSCTSVDHPRHLAFVPSAPSRAAILFDLVVSASSIHGAYWLEGGGAIFAENQAMKWLVSLTGLPEGAFGVFTSGGTAANLSAMVTAREYWRKKNEKNNQKKGIIITSIGAHSSIKAMAKVTDADVILIPSEVEMTKADLVKEYSELSEETKERVFAVVATGGTTNAGIIDDLAGISSFCEENNIWFHVDAAYGGGALAADSVRHLFNGIEKADSITIDPHKWLFSPYDCGAVIYKKPELAKEAHSQHASYLKIFDDPGAEGFNPSDYQIQLTRRVRGLPLWFSLAMHGTNVYKKSIEKGLELAQIAAQKIKNSDYLSLVREPGLSCVLFRRENWTEQDYKDWTYANIKKQYAFVTPTQWLNNGKPETVARFCFINPETTEEDIEGILQTMM